LTLFDILFWLSNTILISEFECFSALSHKSTDFFLHLEITCVFPVTLCASLFGCIKRHSDAPRFPSFKELRQWEALRVEHVKAQVGSIQSRAKRSTAERVVAQALTKTSGQPIVSVAARKSFTKRTRIRLGSAKAAERFSLKRLALSLGVQTPFAIRWVGIMFPTTVNAAKPSVNKAGRLPPVQARVYSGVVNSSGRRLVSGLTSAQIAVPKNVPNVMLNGAKRPVRVSRAVRTAVKLSSITPIRSLCLTYVLTVGQKPKQPKRNGKETGGRNLAQTVEAQLPTT
jgi:hypothetical protein